MTKSSSFYLHHSKVFLSYLSILAFHKEVSAEAVIDKAIHFFYRLQKAHRMHPNAELIMINLNQKSYFDSKNKIAGFDEMSIVILTPQSIVDLRALVQWTNLSGSQLIQLAVYYYYQLMEGQNNHPGTRVVLDMPYGAWEYLDAMVSP